MSTEKYDIVIVGSTSGAVAAAIQSSKLGRRVAMISPVKHIGGIQVEGLGATDIDNQPGMKNHTTVGGLALELHRRISKHYNRLEHLEEVIAKGIMDPDVWRFEASVVEKIIAEWLGEHQIDIVYAAVKSVTKNDDASIESIECSDGKVYSAKVYMDATYEGDLLALANVSTVIGRESSDTYKEGLAGVRDNTTYTQFPFPIDPYIIPGDASSGLIFGVSDEPFGKAGDADKHLAAYSYRVPITDVPENLIPFTKPPTYDPAHYELHARFVKSGGQLYFPRPRLPNRKTDLIGSEAVLATDLLGMNDEWPTGTPEVREKILLDTTNFTKGLLYFFANDERLPEDFRAEWSRWGYPKDEFPDNDNFPRGLYIRDARRMVSDYVITEHTASRDHPESPSQVPDPIAVAFWPTDTHCVRRIVRNGAVHNEGFIFKDGHKWRPFGIAYRALVPKRAEATNLLTPTCPSSSHVGYGAVRLEHQFYSIGQACANAADLAIEKGVPVQDVPYPALQARLLEQGVVIDATKVGAPIFPDELPEGVTL